METNYFSDSLITISSGPINLLLTCGYGQPVTTSVYLKRNDGSNEKIGAFEGDVTNLFIGNSSDLKFSRIEIHSTIHDIRDIEPGQEVEDIKLFERISCNNEVSVQYEFVTKTIGSGKFINCIYEITIL